MRMLRFIVLATTLTSLVGAAVWFGFTKAFACSCVRDEMAYLRRVSITENGKIVPAEDLPYRIEASAGRDGSVVLRAFTADDEYPNATYGARYTPVGN